MNLKELKFFKALELEWPDCTGVPASLLMKALWVKLRRKLVGRWADRGARFVWTTTTVSDAYGPADNVRNYRDRRTIRTVLSEIARQRPLRRACELGCGYGRVIMVLKEFAEFVKGFEREAHLVTVAQSLLPDIVFEEVGSLADIGDETPYDVAMTFTVLQHLTDADAREVCETMKRLAPAGHILCVEKTENIATTANTEDGARFISQARPIEIYADFMHPFRLVRVQNRVVEPTYFNTRPGSCMLFASPLITER